MVQVEKVILVLAVILFSLGAFLAFDASKTSIDRAQQMRAEATLNR